MWIAIFLFSYISSAFLILRILLDITIAHVWSLRERAASSRHFYPQPKDSFLVSIYIIKYMVSLLWIFLSQVSRNEYGIRDALTRYLFVEKELMLNQFILSIWAWGQRLSCPMFLTKYPLRVHVSLRLNRSDRTAWTFCHRGKATLINSGQRSVSWTLIHRRRISSGFAVWCGRTCKKSNGASPIAVEQLSLGRSSLMLLALTKMLYPHTLYNRSLVVRAYDRRCSLTFYTS